MTDDGWTPCPRCGSKRVNDSVRLTNLFFMIGAGSILILIGILLIWWPMAMFGIVLAVAAPIMLFTGKMYQCKDCNKVWKASKQNQSV